MESVWSWLGVPLLIFCARAIDVSLGTLRIVLVSRGARLLAPLVGFFEALVWIVALSQVVQRLDRPLQYFAWAAGFGLGTWLGLVLDQRLGLGHLAVRIVTDDDASRLVEALRERDFGVTSFAARGLKGKVRFLLTVIRRRDLPKVQRIVSEIEPEAFVSVSDVRQASEGFFPAPGGRFGRWFGRSGSNP